MPFSELKSKVKYVERGTKAHVDAKSLKAYIWLLLLVLFRAQLTSFLRDCSTRDEREKDSLENDAFSRLKRSKNLTSNMFIHQLLINFAVKLGKRK